jgi:hypothetical protein
VVKALPSFGTDETGWNDEKRIASAAAGDDTRIAEWAGGHLRGGRRHLAVRVAFA